MNKIASQGAKQEEGSLQVNKDNVHNGRVTCRWETPIARKVVGDVVERDVAMRGVVAYEIVSVLDYISASFDTRRKD